MSAEIPNGEPKKPAEVSSQVRQYLEKHGGSGRIHELFEKTRISLQGARSRENASHLEGLQDLEAENRYDKAAHEEWINKLPKERQTAYFRFNFLMRSLRTVLINYADAIAEQGSSEQLETEMIKIIDEIFENLELESLEDENIENEKLKALAVSYSRLRKSIIDIKSFEKKYRWKAFEKLTQTLIKIFIGLRSIEPDEEKRTAIGVGLQDLRVLQEKIEGGDKVVKLEALEKLEQCYLKFSELRTVVPAGSMVISRLYGRMNSESIAETKDIISKAVLLDDNTPEKIQAKSEYLKGAHMARAFPVSEEGDGMLTEALATDLLAYIPKDIPKKLREEFRKELKALMIGINRVLMHLQTVKEINSIDPDTNKNLQLALLWSIKEDLVKLQDTLEEYKNAQPIPEAQYTSPEIGMIVCEVEVRESEALGEAKDPMEILRTRKYVARLGLSHAVNKVLEKIKNLFDKIEQEDPEYNPDLEIKDCYSTSANKLKRAAQLIVAVFDVNKKLIDMFPEIEQDISESVKFREDFYTFYITLTSIARQIESQVSDNVATMEKRVEFRMLIAMFKNVIDENSDLISRMRPMDREVVVKSKIKIDKYLDITSEERIPIDHMALEIQDFIIAIGQIALEEINRREFLKNEDGNNIGSAIDSLVLSLHLLCHEEVSKEVLLRVVTRLTEANSSLKKAFYRNPKLLIKIQKRLNEISEELLDKLIASMHPGDTPRNRKRKIKIDEDLKARILSFLTVAGDRLDIIHELL
ncbi:MAG: hypothetical protein ABID64_01345 [Nitrospirota bacterium]